MAKIPSILQILFVVLVISPGLKSEKNQITCYFCDGECDSPPHKTMCDEKHPVGIPAIGDDIQLMLNAGNHKNETHNSIINQFKLEPFSRRSELLCFKLKGEDDSGNKVFGKGCSTRINIDIVCATFNTEECLKCGTDLCNAAGSIKSALTMILVPIVILIFTRT
ncbi:uncharacterized protein [Prorops nasuta]|uniref:uncharacterized protein n=1 Tax=Prorops nasuta TaxID=863751 RepID=UPI0034CFD365